MLQSDLQQGGSGSCVTLAPTQDGDGPFKRAGYKQSGHGALQQRRMVQLCLVWVH